MLSQDISMTVSRKERLEDFGKTWDSWAPPQHQLCVVFHRTEQMPCQSSGPC